MARLARHAGSPYLWTRAVPVRSTLTRIPIRLQPLRSNRPCPEAPAPADGNGDAPVEATRAPRLAVTMCARLTLSLALALAACGRTEAPPATPADSAATGGAAADSVTSDSAAVVPADTAATPAPGDSVLPAPLDSAQATVTDSVLAGVRAEIARLATGLEAVRRSTDSLRVAVEASGGAAGSGGAQPDTAGTQTLSGVELIEDAGASVRHYGLRTFWALVVLFVTFQVIRIVVYVVDQLAERSAQRRLFFKRLVPVVRIIFWVGALTFVVRSIFDVSAQGLLAAMAAIGVAIGFAAQDLIKNLFGGLVIVFDQPFQVGDKIEVAGTYGEVVSIGLRSTRIVTPDDSIVSVPNAQVVDGQVSNANSGALDCQVVTDLYLPGWVDEAAAKRIAYQVAASSRYVFLGKPIVVLVRDEFKETFLTHLKVKAYVVDTRHEFAFMSDVTERARLEFRKHGLLQPMHGARAWVDLTGIREIGDAPEEGPEA